MKTISGFFIGYSTASRGCRFYCPSHSTRVIESDRAVFFENDLESGVSTPRPVTLKEDRTFLPMPVVSLPTDIMFPNVQNIPNTQEDVVLAPAINEGETEHISEQNVEHNNAAETIALRRSQRARKSTASNDYVYLQEHEFDFHADNDPSTFHEAISCSHASDWTKAMHDELASMSHNEVWDLTELPVGCKAVGCKWVFKTKRDPNGKIERYKAILVAKGYSQREGIDYKETFSPVSTKDAFRVVMALVAHFDLELHHMDVKTAFLNGELAEDVYMFQPEGFAEAGKEHLVCKLNKSIYGLKQASRQCCINLLNETRKMLSSHFNMKDLGDSSVVLGIQIFRDRSRGVLGLSQKGYIEKILKRFNMHSCSPCTAPILKGDKLSNSNCPQNDKETVEMEKVPYSSAVGSLMYAQVCTCPDIAFAVNYLGRYLSNPGLGHWKAVKKVLRYLQGTKDYMLTYKKSDQLEVIGYFDSDLAGCLDDRKSTSSLIFMMVGGAISWKIVKQTTIATSTMEAEYVACYEATCQAVWLKNLISYFRVVDSISRPLAAEELSQSLVNTMKSVLTDSQVEDPDQS
ncbi:unnamed protein product [Trifolium pratense]|uniref:Uncharacterized protein n=1 Tax=Trifolium pratense TaxID=57577 RepID=A0ACB0L0X1_TRIPR|nr:unnamed protein product [Trifolium pratense]